MRGIGYVRCSALGPISQVLTEVGVDRDRIFRRSDLPVEILAKPELPLRLTDHYRLLAVSARETGIPCFGAFLGRQSNAQRLGRYGAWLINAPTLALSIARAGTALNRMMQTNTDLILQPLDAGYLWSMIFHTSGHQGRYQNELLALSYQLDIMRAYLGQEWRPNLIRIMGGDNRHTAALEDIFDAPVRCGYPSCGIEFEAPALAASRTAFPQHDSSGIGSGCEMPMPETTCSEAAIIAAVEIEIMNGLPRITDVAGRLAISVRTLQRLLAASGHSFGSLTARLLYDRATALLRRDDRTIQEVASEMGYSDHAHFTRAFRHWSGLSPREYRQWGNRQV